MISASERISAILSQYLIQLPIWIVWLVGLALAVTRWRRHPRVSLLVVVALAIFFGRGLLTPALSILVVHGSMGARLMSLLFSGLNVASSLLGALAWGLLIAAVFVARDDGDGQVTP